jgi:hypothetical protein
MQKRAWELKATSLKEASLKEAAQKAAKIHDALGKGDRDVHFTSGAYL